MSEFDVAIVGGGPGGYVAAIRSAQLGLKTVLIERDAVGGTCLNIGCIPTKTLAKNAELIHEIESSGNRGLIIDNPVIDMPKTISMKNNIVAQLVGGVRILLKRNGVTLIKGDARVLSGTSISVNEEEIKFDHLIIATGSSNSIPPIPGLDRPGILTSTEILELKYVPKNLLIIGGGVIGCEFATIFNSFGSKVTIVEAMPYILPLMDADVSTAMKKGFTLSGIKALTNCKVTGVKKKDDSYAVMLQGADEEIVSVDEILVSVGRKPNLGGLDGINLEFENQYIKVDDHMRTNLKNIYAIGDVTGRMQLAHVASAQGIIAAENIAGKQSRMSYSAIPSCVYTIPEIGSVGLTEAQAKEQYDAISIGKFPMSACGKAIAMGTENGFAKIIAAKKDGKLLGCHIVGPNATEVISGAVAVMQRQGTIEDISHIIHAHPTISESVLEAARAAMGDPIHIM